MIKKLLFSGLLATMSIGVYAQNTSTFEFTYANNGATMGAIGDRVAETVDVAMLLDNPAMAGMKVTGIKAYTNVWTDITNSSVWIADRLILNNGVFKPGIAQYDVTPVQGAYGGDSELGLFSATLDEPYVLTGEPVYFGYSTSIVNASGMGQQYPVLTTKNYHEGSFYFHSTKGITNWTDYSGNGCAVIILTIEKDSQEYSVGINSFGEVFAADGQGFNVPVSLVNAGSQPINTLTYTYNYDNIDQLMTGTYTFETPLDPDLYNTTDVTLQFDPINGLGKHNVNMTITEVNGMANTNQAASGEFSLEVYSYLPTHRPLIEEYTGLWCGYCPRGYIAMERIAEDYGDAQVSICYHDNSQGADPMTVTRSFPMAVSGFPNSSVDRIDLIDPYYGSSNTDMGILGDVNSAMASLAVADINVSAVMDGDIIKVTTETSFIQDVKNANYQIGYVLTCSGLSDPSWFQSNYFARQSNLMGTPLEEVAQWPSRKGGLIFNDVAVDVSGMLGIRSSLPTTIESGETYVHEYEFNTAGNPVIKDQTTLTVTAFVIAKNNGRIVNANKYELPEKFNGVDKVSTPAEVIAVEYYDLTGAKVLNPNKGIYIKSEKLSNGQTKSSKVIL